MTRALLVFALCVTGCASTRGALGKETVLEDRDMVWSIAISPDATRVAVVKLSGTNFVLELDAADGRKLWSRVVDSSEHDVDAVEFSSDGTWVGAVSKGGVLLVTTVEPSASTLDSKTDVPLTALAFHPDNQRVAIGLGDGTIEVHWLPREGHQPSPVVAHVHDGPVRALVFAPDGRLFSAGADDRKFWAGRVADDGTLTQEASVRGQWFINDLALSGDRLAAAMSKERHLRSPQLRARELKKDFGEPRGGDCAVVLDLTLKQLGDCRPIHRGPVTTAALRPGTDEIASGGWDASVILESKRAARKLGWEIRRVRFSKDGRLLAVAAWTPQNATGEHSAPSALLIQLDSK